MLDIMPALTAAPLRARAAAADIRKSFSEFGKNVQQKLSLEALNKRFSRSSKDVGSKKVAPAAMEVALGPGGELPPPAEEEIIAAMNIARVQSRLCSWSL